MFARSIGPSESPPIKVWTSSINKIVLWIFFNSSTNNDIVISSLPFIVIFPNNEVELILIILYPFNAFGTLSCWIKYANPSTIAVLPIPALPTNKADLSGVKTTTINFFISSSRAIAGLVTYVLEVKSSPYISNTGVSILFSTLFSVSKSIISISFSILSPI